MNLFCVVCKKRTANSNEPKRVTTSNNRHMLRTKCKVCNTTKTQFVK